MRYNLIDLTGQQFGRLKVIRQSPRINSKEKTKWICQCECGVIKKIESSKLRNGDTKSCGCLKLDLVTKHGDYKTRFYSIWLHMNYRCNNTNDSHYARYGGRGISVCERWKDYLNFKEDMYESYLNHIDNNNGDTSIERVDNDGDYEPSNCVWATNVEQQSNTSNSVRFIGKYIGSGKSYGYKEESTNMSEFARKYGLNRSCVRDCLYGKQHQHKNWIFKYV